MATVPVGKTDIRDVTGGDEIQTFEDEDEKTLLLDENIHSTILDQMISMPMRLKAVKAIFQQEGFDNTYEVLNKIIMMYHFTGTVSLKKFIYTVAIESDIDIYLRALLSKSLCEYDEDGIEGYEALVFLYPKLDHLSVILRFDFILYVLKREEFTEKARTYFCELINDSKIDCDYRMKNLAGVDNKMGVRGLYFIKEALLQFIGYHLGSNPASVASREPTANTSSHRIVACQWLLAKSSKFQEKDEPKVSGKLSQPEKAYTLQQLVMFASDSTLDYNLRADATDVLLRHGDATTSVFAEEMILFLGRENKITRTLYDNAQNVHVQEIEASVQKTLEVLITNLSHVKDKYTFDDIKTSIFEFLQTLRTSGELGTLNADRITISLNRIFVDRALYSKHSIHLVGILTYVYAYIQNQKDGSEGNKKEMMLRLSQELDDSAGLCSTGYANRLINAITGFGEFTLSIGWREQIVSNFAGRLNAKIRALENEDIKGNILEQLTISTTSPDLRKDFLKFLRDNFSNIREELYSEFKDHLDDTTFDLYIRFAMSKYESGDEDVIFA